MVLKLEPSQPLLLAHPRARLDQTSPLLPPIRSMFHVEYSFSAMSPFQASSFLSQGRYKERSSLSMGGTCVLKDFWTP